MCTLSKKEYELLLLGSNRPVMGRTTLDDSHYSICHIQYFLSPAKYPPPRRLLGSILNNQDLPATLQPQTWYRSVHSARTSRRKMV